MQLSIELKKDSKYYSHSFILITDLNGTSTAVDYANVINFWIDNVPEWEEPNWVLGNHDRSRVATRLTPDVALGTAFVEMTLPGYAVIYNVKAAP